MKILVSEGDDLLYKDLIQFLYEVKIAQGVNGLSFSLVNHPKVRDYLKTKQKQEILYYESFINNDGSINKVRLSSLKEKS